MNAMIAARRRLTAHGNQTLMSHRRITRLHNMPIPLVITRIASAERKRLLGSSGEAPVPVFATSLYFDAESRCRPDACHAL